MGCIQVKIVRRGGLTASAGLLCRRSDVHYYEMNGVLVTDGGKFLFS